MNKDNSCHLLLDLLTLPYLIIKQPCFLHFTDEEIEPETLNNLLKNHTTSKCKDLPGSKTLVCFPFGK